MTHLIYIIVLILVLVYVIFLYWTDSKLINDYKELIDEYKKQADVKNKIIDNLNSHIVILKRINDNNKKLNKHGSSISKQ